MPKVRLTITDSRCRSGYCNVRAKMFDAKCPDECRVSIHGEIVED